MQVVYACQVTFFLRQGLNLAGQNIFLKVSYSQRYPWNLDQVLYLSLQGADQGFSKVGGGCVVGF